MDIQYMYRKHSMCGPIGHIQYICSHLRQLKLKLLHDNLGPPIWSSLCCCTETVKSPDRGSLHHWI